MSDIIAWLVALYVLFLVVKVTLAKIEHCISAGMEGCR